jgi:DnaJ family protein A protein 2
MFNFFDCEPIVDRREHLYNVLGVEPGADQTTIKKAYRSLAMEHHPDKGGSAEKFKVISDAYTRLTSAAASGPTFQHPFTRRATRPSVQIIRVSVTLPDLFMGVVKAICISTEEPCTCSTPCVDCGGTGTCATTIQLLPGMVQRVMTPCNTCRRTGSVFSPACGVCTGRGFVNNSVAMDIIVPPGTESGKRYDHGHFVLELVCADHDVFTRRGSDLFMEQTILLSEALTGVSFPVRHLDGTTRILQYAGPSVIQFNSVKCVIGGGMPLAAAPSVYGDLYVRLVIQLPHSLTDVVKYTLKTLLPAREELGPWDAGVIVMSMTDADTDWSEDPPNNKAASCRTQ